MSRHYCRKEMDNPYVENLGIQAIAQEYCAKMGFPPIQKTPYAQVNKTVAKKLADLFESTPDQSDDPEVRKCYQAMVDEVNLQWKMLPVNVEPFDDDFVPYKDSPAMMDDVINNGHLWVYDGGDDHSLLTRKENFKFRACHDIFGHCSHGYAFGERGENAAWMEHCKMFSPLARNSLTVETKFQNSFVNNGPYSHLPVKDRPYAPQKVMLAPWKYCTTPELQRAYKDYPDFFPPVEAENPRRRR